MCLGYPDTNFLPGENTSGNADISYKGSKCYGSNLNLGARQQFVKDRFQPFSLTARHQ